MRASSTVFPERVTSGQYCYVLPRIKLLLHAPLLGRNSIQHNNRALLLLHTALLCVQPSATRVALLTWEELVFLRIGYCIIVLKAFEAFVHSASRS